MTIIVIINAQNKYVSHKVQLQKFNLNLDNIIVLSPWKFRDIDPLGTAAMLILRRSSVCGVNWTSLAAM